MVTLEKFLRPDLPEGRSTELSEGKVMGWVPGEITSLEDPERLGRVRVRCDIIQQDTDLPNYCWVLEDFVTNAQAGGAHRLLKIGSQVAMLPMLGDPRQMLLLGCIPSRIDAPSPELNRAEEIYGVHTPGQVFDVNNDSDASWINTRPNGVTEHISGGGDRTTQTRDGGRIQVKADGTVSTENPKASTTINPEGTVQTQNQAGGKSTLNKSGEWDIQASTNSSLSLKDAMAVMTGPAPKLSTMTKDLKSNLGGTLGLGQQLLRQVSALAAGLRGGQDIEMLLSALSPVMDDIQKILKENIPQALSTLTDLQGSTDELVEHLTDQLQTFIDSGLDQAAGLINQALSQFPDDISQALNTLTQTLAPELASQINPDTLTPLLKGLSHDAAMQEQAILEAIAPAEFENFQNIIGLDLHNNIGEIQSILDTVTSAFQQASTSISDISNITDQALETILTQAETELIKLIPESLSSLVTSPDIQQMIQLAITGGNPMTLLMSTAASGLVSDLSSQLEEIGINIPQIEAIAAVIANPTDISQLTEVLGLGEINPAQVLDKILPDAIDSVGNVLGGLFGKGKKKANKLFNGLGSAKSGGTIKASGDKVEAYADSSMIGAKLEISKPKASLKGVGGAAEIFAGVATAGIKTPFGSFGLGEDGGNLLTKGMMAFKVLQDIGKVAGLVMSPESGISLSSFPDSQSKEPSAAVTVDEGVVDISAQGNNNIKVSPDGVYVEGYRVADYLDQFVSYRDEANTRFQTVEATNTSQEQVIDNQTQAIRGLSDRLTTVETLRWYRCIRNAIYQDVSPEDQLATYLRTNSIEEATRQMGQLFPEEISSGFTVSLATLL